MEDAATAEISRAQVWQWINSPNGVLADGRNVTVELVQQLLPEEIEKIEARIRIIAAKHRQAVVILDVPLLFEARMETDLKDIIVVYVPESTQLKRLMQRDHLCEADAWKRIRAQMPIEEKRLRATMVIDNSGSLAQTRQSALNAYQTLCLKPQ
jgi:dephospho-CoA kinase